MTPTAHTNVPALKGEVLISDLLADRTDLVLGKVAHAVKGVAERTLAPYGLSCRHHAVLKALAHRGPRSQQALGDELRIDRSTMVGTVDDLERDGRVERVRNPDDRRSYTVHITDAGRTLLGSADEAVADIADIAFAPLSAEERAELARLLLRLARAGHLPRVESTAATVG